MFRKKVSITDKMFFTQYLALMLRSGISLTRALDFLSLQTSNPRMKEVAIGLSQDITTGMSVAQSFSKYPDIFDELFINMISAGETAGNLEEVLLVIAEELRKSSELRSKVIGALIYPAIIVTMMIAVSIFIVFFVFPRIIKVYESLKVEVPTLTRIFILVVKFLVSNVPFIIGGVILFIVGLIIFSRFSFGRRTFHLLWLNFPIIQNLNKKVNVVQFCRTLASLLKSGIAIPQAFEITSRTFQNSFYREAVTAMAIGIRQGKKISELVGNYPKLFPTVVSQMMGVGEETGRLTEILRQVAGFYEQEVNIMLDNFSKIIEPVLMLIIGFGVGTVALATVQLIYASLQAVSR